MSVHDNKIPAKIHPEFNSAINSEGKNRVSFGPITTYGDRNPQGQIQSKFQQMANDSNQVKQLMAFQKMANTSNHVQKGFSQNSNAPISSSFQTPSIQKKKKSEIGDKENKTGLPNTLKSGIEQLSGLTMDDVKVHYNSDMPAQLQAHAFAQGSNIHIASGQEKHLAHEAWHVVQQKQGRVQPTVQMKGNMLLNDDSALELEADKMGAKALQKKSIENYEIADTPKVTLNHSSQNGPQAVVQAFGINDRNWKAVKSVKSLKGSGGVYLCKAGEEALVVKTGGIGDNAIQEALAAEMGNIGAIGVNTIKTIPLSTQSAEVVKGLFPKLKKLAPDALEILSQDDIILVMEFIEGKSVREAGTLFHGVEPSVRHSWYRSMGRLWAFDVFISNSDRYIASPNMGNIMISNEGVIYGIDQAMGMSTTDDGGRIGELKAASQLEDIMDGGARLAFCKTIYLDVNSDIEDYDLNDEAAFCTHFEKGILDALPGIGSISMEQVLAARGQLPGEVQGVAEQIGLGGMPGIIKAFGSTILGVRSRPVPIPGAIPMERRNNDGPEDIDPVEQSSTKGKQIRSKYYSKLGLAPKEEEETQFDMEM